MEPRILDTIEATLLSKRVSVKKFFKTLGDEIAIGMTSITSKEVPEFIELLREDNSINLIGFLLGIPNEEVIQLIDSQLTNYDSGESDDQ